MAVSLTEGAARQSGGGPRLRAGIAAYLALKAWKKNLACVVLEKEELLTLLDSKKIKNHRIDELIAYSDETGRPVHSKPAIQSEAKRPPL